MQKERMETTPFAVNAHGTTRSALPALPVAARAHRGKMTVKGGSMAIKIGACVGVLALVMAAQLLFHPADDAVMAAQAGAKSGQDTDETPGRLRFVSGKGAASSVFSDRQRWTPPVFDVTDARTRPDQTMALTVLPGDVVSCPASGEVREIDADDALGAYVRVSHGGGLESIYFNLDEVLVELGQPLQALDTLGTVGESGVLYVSVLQSGGAQPPDDYMLIAQGS